jgi:hypothetical protein
MNSFFRQLGSLGSKSQFKMQRTAAAAGQRASAAARARAGTTSYKNRRIKRGASMTTGALTSAQDSYARRAGNAARISSMRSQQVAAGRRRATALGAGIGTLGVGTAMRPNPNQQQTMYRGPMNTGRGVGRYS